MSGKIIFTNDLVVYGLTQHSVYNHLGESSEFNWKAYVYARTTPCLMLSLRNLQLSQYEDELKKNIKLAVVTAERLGAQLRRILNYWERKHGSGFMTSIVSFKEIMELFSNTIFLNDSSFCLVKLRQKKGVRLTKTPFCRRNSNFVLYTSKRLAYTIIYIPGNSTPASFNEVFGESLKKWRAVSVHFAHHYKFADNCVEWANTMNRQSPEEFTKILGHSVRPGLVSKTWENIEPAGQRKLTKKFMRRF